MIHLELIGWLDFGDVKAYDLKKMTHKQSIESYLALSK